jgi:hypothetical protein
MIRNCALPLLLLLDPQPTMKTTNKATATLSTWERPETLIGSPRTPAARNISAVLPAGKALALWCAG